MALLEALQTSWGGMSARAARVIRPANHEALSAPQGRYLAIGAGRSYGDSALIDGGTLIDTHGMRRILSFDPASGIMRAEAGISLAEILECAIPLGWFLPVTPGTRYVTLGGAIANDVHGKNHHRAGSFGRYVTSLLLLRSDGSQRVCSPHENAAWLNATIGGMGLTGVIGWAEIQLLRVTSPDVRQETIPLGRLADFFSHLDESDARFEYGVAWLDSLAKGASLGRGVLMRANHATASEPGRAMAKPARVLSLPFTPPISLVNGLSMRAFNAAYRWRATSGPAERLVPWASFFYPLDGVAHWNRAYGPKGLRQHQSVLPRNGAENAVSEMLMVAQAAGHASFLTVLKSFGDRPGAGLLSFARPGVTLTLDFAYRGAATDALLERLDAITLAAGGAVNPYKDGRMSADTFRASFPEWRNILPFLDPHAESCFSNRVGLTGSRA
ncbi:MAG: FAD-binding oxidoreductase [Bosea sp. (in: a-proteobacteria)]